ncbi:alpha/beta hydrolase family protein [Mycolicibacterium sp. 050158]|uniref:alpha/beta hydrolase family protein n=1 Tax=Mycolicibacterium sp. 050158 TaxID=3090602 RepID=UPI00299E6D67|nr:alpha/beta fold hydrolase [Mycolicibacterium sp. 050158]MDX1891790.1 alpha/beta hydrolase [Mycolicibacterium sp. 050158]
MKILLDDPEMDAQLSRTVIAVAAEAADLGEVFTTAARVTEGDYDSWYAEWSATAKAAQTLAEDALRGGHEVTARKAFLRASEYWRQSFFFLRHDLDDERLQHAWRRHRETFRAALPLMDCQVLTTEIPYDGVAMTGYLFRPADADTPRPTIMAPCGMDSTAEAGYVATGYMALPRGYNFFVFEGPGQGGTLYEHRRPFRPDFEEPFAGAFEWLLEQDGVHPHAVIVMGRSFGGYLGPRAAAFESRVAALVADPGQYDFASRIGNFAKTLGYDDPDAFLSRLLAVDADLDAELQKVLSGPRNVEWYGARMAAMGTTTVGDLLRKQLSFTLEGVAADIRCPTLLTEGEGDFAAQGELLFEQLTCERRLTTFSEAEGGGGHCEGLGSTLFEGYAFDWIDRILGRAQVPAGEQ